MDPTLESLLFEGRLIGNLSYILLIVSMAMRDMFWLRLLAILSGLMGAAYAYLWMNNPVGTFWELSFTAVNVIQWSWLLYERRLKHLSPEEARLKKAVFPMLSIMDFRRLMKQAERMQFLLGDILLLKDQEVLDVFVILEGEAGVFVDDELVSTCIENDFIGEIGFLNSIPASATVSARTTMDCLVFDAGTIRYYTQRNPELERGLNEAMSANLAAKLLRRNQVQATA
jgi:hypothetical protein